MSSSQLAEQFEPEDQKMMIYRDKQSITFISGIIMMAAYEALETQDATRLKEIIAQFCSENPLDIVNANVMGFKPLKSINPNNVIRHPDQVREQCMIDDSVDNIATDSPCRVSFYNGEIYVWWTMPRIEYVMQCDSVNKLVYNAMVIVEELFHIRQMITPNTRAITVLGVMIELEFIEDIGQMDDSDRDLLKRILETDVTFFFDTYFKEYIQHVQWFLDRTSSTDDHQPMTPQEFIEGITYLVSKYGKPENLAKTIFADIISFIEKNPELGLQMLLANGLKDFIDLGNQ